MSTAFSLSYSEISFILWLREESENIAEFQAYPSSPESQSYLPMTFLEQKICIQSLVAKGMISTKLSNNRIMYQLSKTCLDHLTHSMDIYASCDDVSNFTVVKIA